MTAARAMSAVRALAVVLALAPALAGCASTSDGVTRDRNQLTRAEIEAAGQSTALEVIRSERPHWLLERGARSLTNPGEVVVYLDGSRLGGPGSLAGVAAIDVEQMRYYSDRQAQLKWGPGHLHGAIEVITRRN